MDVLDERRLGSRYVLTHRLGRGAMGQVYRARVDAPGGGPDADVAVKILVADLAADADGLRRFLQEGRLLKRVDHPHVVRIHDVVAEADEFALVMDLVEGGDLRHAVPIPCAEGLAARIGAGIAVGLAAVHAAGIQHRDLKPENVLVEHRPDGTALARIADFGVARLDATAATRTHGLAGTLGYIAPEVARGGHSLPAGDVYALGAVLYELCAGHLPFGGEHALAVLRAHAEDPAPRPAGMSDPMWAVVSVLLSKNPAERPTAAELADHLHHLAGFLEPAAAPLPPGVFLAPLPPPVPLAPPVAEPQPVAAPPPAPVTRGGAPAGDAPVAVTVPVAHPRPRRLLYPIAAAAVAVAAVTGGVWAVVASSPSPPAAGAGQAVAPFLAPDVGGPTTSGPAPTSVTPPAATPAASTGGGRRSAVQSPPATVAGPSRRTATGTPAVRPQPVAGARTTASADPRAGTVPLYRYADASTGHHVYVLDASELARFIGTFTLEGTQGRVHPTKAPGTVPLYRYFEKTSGDYLYTADYGELGAGDASFAYQGIEAYVYASAGPGRIAMYRYFNSYTHDHMLTTDYGEFGKGTGVMTLDGICCYVVR